jgi:hypothetical protein
VKIGGVPGQKEKPVVVTPAGKEGMFTLQGKAMTEEALRKELSAMAANDHDIMVFIRADESVKYEEVVRLLDLLSRLKINNISFSSSKQEQTDATAAPTAKQDADVAQSRSLSDDLPARLKAAEEITAFTTKDEVLAGIAQDSAKAGMMDCLRKALESMTAFTKRDEAICKSARVLAASGKRADALSLLDLITAFPTRDALTKELAK